MPDLVYRLLGQGDQFFQTMRTGTAEAKRADTQLEKLTSTMDRQRSAGEMSARQQEILTLADKGASAAKVEYALALAGELDSLEALQVAEARDAAAKERAASVVTGLITSLERENQALTLTTAELLELQMRSTGATASQIEFALEVQRANVAIQEEQISIRNLAAAEAQAAQYAQGLIDKLRFQNDTLAMSSEAVERLTLRKRGLSEAEIESVIALQREATALREKQQAETEATAATDRDSAAVRRIIGDLREEQMALGASDEELLRRKLVTLGADQATVNLALSIRRSISAANEDATAVKNLNATEAEAARYAKELTDRLSMQALQFGMTEDAAQRLELRLKGLSAAEIQQVQTLRQEITALQAAKEAQEAKNQAMAKGSAGLGGMSRNSMLLTESMRGLEDAVAGATNNGFKGMLMATTNNTNQIGSLLGGTAGLALSVGSVAGLIGVSLIPMLMKWGDNTEELRKKEQALADDQKRHHDEYMAQIAERIAAQSQNQSNKEDRANLIGDRNASSSALESQLKRDKNELEKNQADQRTIREQSFARAGRRMSLEEQLRTLQTDPGKNKAEIEAKQKELNEIEAAEREGQARLRALRIDEHNIQANIEETNAARVAAHKREQDKKALEEAEREKNEWIKLKADRAKQEKEIADKAAADQTKADRARQTEEKRQKDLLGEIRKNDDTNLGAIDKRAAAEKAARDRYAADVAKIDQAKQEGLITEAEAKAYEDRAAVARDKRLADAANEGKDKEKPDKAPKELTATSARSNEGIKAIYDALGMGNPQMEAIKTARETLVAQRELLEESKRQTTALEKLKPVKVS